MSSIRIIITLISIIMIKYVSTAQTHSRVEVAQCRSMCLDLYQDDCISGDNGDCSSCWDTCDVDCVDLQLECLEEDAGCQSACQWQEDRNRVTSRARSSRRLDRGQVWDLVTPLTMDQCDLTWGKVTVSSNSYRSSTGHVTRHVSPPVYVVLGQTRDSEEWYEIAQTSARSHTLEPSITEHLDMVRLVVVGQEGIRTVASLFMTEDMCDYQDQIRPVLTQSFRQPSSDLVTVTVSWDTVSDDTGAGEYILRWQEYPVESSVMATMLVKNPSAEISLLAETTYIVQVEDRKTGQLSEPIMIDTREYSEIVDIPDSIIIATVTVISLLLISALLLAVCRYCREKKQVNEKININNNEIEILDKAKEPLALDYNNLC